MNKGKRLGLIIGTAILSIILIVTFSTVAVKSITVKRSIELGNKYIAEGNYKEAIIAFEKAIKIDSKNTGVKETLNILYVYEEVVELIAESEIDKAQEKLEEIKDIPKFDIIKESFESVESNIQSELIKDGMGNSIQNILAGGYIAYKNEYVFYKNIEDNDKLYRLNTKNNENIKLSDDTPCSINIYEDYVYYDAYTYYEMYDDIFEKSVGIKRVKFDGSESELVVDRNNISTMRVQIIDNILYYSEFKGNNGFPEEEIIALDLKTNEKNTLISIDTSKIRDFILVRNSNDGIDLIMYPFLNTKIQLVKDININELRSPIEIGKESLETNIIGISYENIYYVYRANYSNYRQVYSIGRDGGNIRSLILNLYSGILGSEYIYYVYDNKLISYELENQEGKIIKNIDIIDYKLYEVNGYLAYYDKNQKLIIDKDITIIEYKNKENKELENNDEEEKDIVLEISDSEFSKLNEIMTETLFDGYDRENPDMDKIIYKTYKIANDSNYTYTGSDGYIFGIKNKDVIDNTMKRLFNLKIDSTTLTDDLSELKKDMYRVGFINDKYYKREAASFDKFYQVRIANSIIKKNDGTYYIEFTEYEADRPDSVNWFHTENLDRDFINREKYLIVTGSGFAEIKEEIVNGEEIRYFTKFKMN